VRREDGDQHGKGHEHVVVGANQVHGSHVTPFGSPSSTTGESVPSKRSMMSRIVSSKRGSRPGSSLSLFAILAMRSTGLGILPIGSVGIVTGAGLDILAAVLEV